MATFPAIKASKLLAILTREPLNYRTERQSGHRRLISPTRPPITFAFHDRQTIAPGLVRKILVRDIGLSEDEALRLL